MWHIFCTFKKCNGFKTAVEVDAKLRSGLRLIENVRGEANAYYTFMVEILVVH